MAEKKLVVLSGLDITKLRESEFSALCDAIAHVEEYDYNCLIISIPQGFIDEGRLPKKPSSNLVALSKGLVPVRFERSTPQRLAAWASKHFAHHGVQASADVCAAVVEYCGTCMFTLASEIEKLSLYAVSQGRTVVQRSDIPLICVAEIESDTFEFANAIMWDRRADALDALSVMKFKQVKPHLILAEIVKEYSNLTLTKILLSTGATQKDIASKLGGIHEYKASLYMKAAGNMELERLRSLLDACAEADAEIKSYDRSYLPLEKLICSI